MIILGKLGIVWHWKSKWIKPRYGLQLTDYDLRMNLWVDGQECQVVKISHRRKKIMVKSKN